MKDSEKIVEGLDSMYRKLLEFKKYRQTSVVVSRNGQVVELKAQDLPSDAKVYHGALGKSL